MVTVAAVCAAMVSTATMSSRLMATIHDPSLTRTSSQTIAIKG